MREKGTDLILVGTRKGAFIFTSKNGRKTWKMRGPYFKGNEVFHLVYDPRNDTIFAGVNNTQWGPTVMRSLDLGENWKESRRRPRYSKGSGSSVEQMWHIEPGPESSPDVVYVGVAPAGLFVSEDSGETWTIVEGLTAHPTRKKWTPGAGGLCLHSLLVDPRNPRHLHVGISAVGVLYSDNGGETWNFQNRHVRAGFLPNNYPEYGQCVHKLLRVRGEPDHLVQMNHCGVYRSYNNGRDWKEITENLPSDFGFSIALDPNDRGRIYAIPEESGENRTP
ncbi:MAG TPA: sialidase family protein, partial [Nitrososphaerales archaeon]|nr:sialidase family protein [Nitrososphaerales archaeon]